ncbi:MAG: TIGR01777 family oxidoreductase [Planctomycetota bacterium]|nr:TIGR01777 family oxidoreductase [Planctomycetota bacterium]
MKVLVSGSTGFLGSALVEFLKEADHKVIRLVRTEPDEGKDEIGWDPAAGRLDKASVEGMDAVVHLSGENLAAGRWTAESKERIRESRIRSTRLLSETLAGLEKPPGVLLTGSAVGYYGDRGEEILREDSGPGKGFLAELGVDWEKATGPAKDKGIRVVPIRTGVVLDPAGGAMAKMLLPFKLGVGGRIGPGTQYMSWISLPDWVAAIQHILLNDKIEGPVNLVAPNPVTNLEFTKAFGKAIFRPTIFPMPAFVARLAFGEMADEALLASTRVEPGRLLDSGFEFQHPQVDAALRAVLGA